MGNVLCGQKTREAPQKRPVGRKPPLKPLQENGASKNYARILDHFSTVDEVTHALKKEGLESSNLIIGIDFTKSNEWTGQRSFNCRCLHTIGDRLNPYEQAITIIGKTLAPFDEDNLIPCFGFGDATTRDQQVFSFHNDHSPCHGFEEVRACYRRIAPKLQLSGPTSFAPIVDAAVDIVEKSGGQFHVLLILADGQVITGNLCDSFISLLSISLANNHIYVLKITRGNGTTAKVLSQQQEETIGSIINASSYPLAIVLVGVGDGPWDAMKEFDDELPKRTFDNFQFVNFTAIMSQEKSESVKDAAFALAALMEIPFQYKACLQFGILGRQTGGAKKVVPQPPPIFSRYQQSLSSSDPPASNADVHSEVCPICSNNVKDLALGCGHVICRECGMYLNNCPICSNRIFSRVRLFTG